MTIISVFWGLCSGASLYKDGKILAAVSEERFTRKKNDSCFPEQSIEWLLTNYNVSKEDIDKIAMVSNDVGMDYILLAKYDWSVDDYLDENNNHWRKLLIENDSTSRDLYLDSMPHKIKLDQYPQEYWTQKVEEKKLEDFVTDKNQLVADYFNADVENVVNIEHHSSHAAYSYYASSFRGEKVLAFTADGWGDGKNATVGIFDEKGNYEMLHTNTQCNIARVYRYMTLLLGMKPSEHEFKVMGLAPYGKEKYAKKALVVFKSTLYVDGLEFKWKNKPTDSYYWFKERLEGVRFDNIAWALQKWTEDLIQEWVKNAINKFGVHKVVFAGGVAMNVKAMGQLAKLEEVHDLFIGGSAGDESHIISTPYCVDKLFSSDWDSKNITSLENLYLGTEYTKEEEESALKSLDNSKYEIIENYTNKQVGKLIFDGNIIARSVGKMEFGQRALGNRSIIADPSKLEAKEKINAAIKNRDFWMPFAPVLLDRYADKYILNSKNIKAPYMTIAFDTTDEGYEAMKAACHPSDKTCRAQILTKEANSGLYELLEEFESLSGRGSLMNTSFNLHGYPIVNSPKDAVYVFENSDLDALVLNNHLVIKK
jgi:carbamoyltransferase